MLKGTVDRISLPFFYQIGARLAPLAHITTGATTKGQVAVLAITLLPELNTLLMTFPSLTVCRSSGERLRNGLEQIGSLVTQENPPDWSQHIQAMDQPFQRVIGSALEFETVLSAELQTLTTYHATQKGIYSTTDLIERAEKALSPSIVGKLDPEMIQEIREAGKCLAFDVPTAAGFHTMRAVEAVLHAYYVKVCDQPADAPKLESWGAYIAALHKKRDVAKDPDIQEVEVLLQQLKDRHRNLIMHPEIVLSDDDAFEVFEIAQAAILAMAKKLPDKAQNTPTIGPGSV
jgi:hypothetical protein